MSKMKIYHTVKGGGEVVTADEVDKLSVPVRVKQIQTDGGFWTDTSFIPWDSITYIEFEKTPGELARFTDILDETLRRINSDYDAKRFKDMALRRPLVRRAPAGTFFNWMKEKGKLGGQHKVPRLANDREYVDSILKMMELVG